MTVAQRARVIVRVLESLVLSAIAGGGVWVLSQMMFNVPLVFTAVLGFLAGGTTMLRTFGVVIRDRRQRIVLAVVCATVAWTVVQIASYQMFLHTLERSHRAADYRLTDAQIHQRIDDGLRRLTGTTGPAGYARAAALEGLPIAFGVTARGWVLALFWLLDLTVAISVAVVWARGPRPRSANVSHTVPSVVHDDARR